jgi:tetratricopeptide (TPR) repeat protein
VCAGADWVVARDGRFEVYSQEGEATARMALRWFEELRATVMQETGLDTSGRNAVRVIGFRSESDYARYRPSPAADAYYVATEDRDYIVMAALGEGSFTVASHEYAHLVQHAAASHLPAWLSEGLADVFATLRIDKRGSRIGGESPTRLNVLRHSRWMALRQLLAVTEHSAVREDRAASELFYAQSWALTEMLALSPAYRSRFDALVAALTGGMAGADAVASVYGKTLDMVTRDLTAWVASRGSRPVVLATAEVERAPVTVSQTPEKTVQLMMAELMLTAGELSGAEAAYRDLAREAPETGEVWAGLGAIAAARKQFDEARELWKRALELGLNDAGICYRYADLLDGAGGRQEERRAALRRAVALKPDFDEARWLLALLEENAGHFEAALEQLQAIRNVMPSRAFSYWCSMADVLTVLGRNEQAVDAARQAAEHAATAEERARAAQLAYMARTHLAVRLSRDAAGNPQMITTRVPNDATGFNPFIEPGDEVRRMEGRLRDIECVPPGMRLVVETQDGRVSLSIPDPARVLMRNAPAEFVCGPQKGELVVVEYAATGVVRGMEFR